MNYEKAYKESMRRAAEYVKAGSITSDLAKAIFDDFEDDKNDESMKEAIIDTLEKYYISNTVFNGYSKKDMISWVKKQVPPKWLYRLEYKDGTCGLWYNGNGDWCFEQGIGSLVGCKTKDLPMDHDERYKQEGRDWFSSCSRKEDLMHWYSLEDAKKLIEKGFVFTRYLATEYHEYENETVFIKDSSLVREEIDIFELFGKTKQEFKREDWVVNRKTGTIHQVKTVVKNVSNNKNAYDLMDGEYISTSEVENYHIWKIENDAIPGDVLVASDSSIFLYNGYEDKGARYFVSLTKFGEIEISNGTHYWETIGACHPSTKEERDLLFAKLKETGYDWDGDNLRLINLKESDLDEENDQTKNLNAVLSYIKDEDLKEWLKNQLKSKEWTVEDRVRIENCISLIGKTGDGEVLWLKELKTRIPPKQKQEWKPTREQLKALDKALNVSIPEIDTVHLLTLYNDLKNLIK